MYAYTPPDRLQRMHVRTRELEEHVITRLGPRHWRCKKPGSSVHWFAVSMGPTMICIYGDIGDLILRPYEADPLNWARSVCLGPRGNHYPDYPLGKAPYSQRTKEFSAEDARGYLKDLERQDAEEEDESYHYARRIREAWDGETEHSWWEACSDAQLDEPPGCRVWTHEALWCYTALCWLMQHIDENGEVRGQAPKDAAE